MHLNMTVLNINCLYKSWAIFHVVSSKRLRASLIMHIYILDSANRRICLKYTKDNFKLAMSKI